MTVHKLKPTKKEKKRRLEAQRRYRRRALTDLMVIALVDTDTGHKGSSPCRDHRVMNRLWERGMVEWEETEDNEIENPFLTKKGKAYLTMCVWEYEDAKACLADHEPRLKEAA